MGSNIVVVLIVGVIVFVEASFNGALPTKENVDTYFHDQFLKAGLIGEKYNGALYDDINFVIVAEPVDTDDDDDSDDDSDEEESEEDEPRLFKFVPPEATVVRGKRTAMQGIAPVRNMLTGAAVVANVDDASDVVPYDAHIHPDFPAEAPVARGLQNFPDGWNLDKDIDWEFKSGYRHGGINSAPAQAVGKAFQRRPIMMAEEAENDGTTLIEGPFIATAHGLQPLGQLQTFTGRRPQSIGAVGFGAPRLLNNAVSYGGVSGNSPVLWG